jgi:predicted DsbA family dithiol-disulfide isomerase
VSHPKPTAVAPVEIVLYQDVLCAWSWVAQRRLTFLVDELDGLVALRTVAYPLRPEVAVPTLQERRRLARAVRRAAKEPECQDLSPDLWLSEDPPLSSIPSLTALAAARLQGAEREARLRDALREAALVQGVNVTRNDVLIELAERSGLDLSRFAAALGSPATEREVLDSYRVAMDQGVDAIPTAVIGDEWLVSGPRDLEEYRAILRRFLSTRVGLSAEPTFH